MKIPGTEHKLETPNLKEAFIKNPFAGKEALTREEALSMISLLSSMLMIDERQRTA